MRPLAICVVVAGLLLPALAAADSPPKIEKVQIGLPGGKGEQDTARIRNGAWAPVYVKLKAGPDGNAIGRFKLRVETLDTENTGYHYDAPVPALVGNQDYIALTYTRPGVAGSDFIVTLLTADDQPAPGVPPVTSSDRDALDPNEVLYLAVGARLPGMKSALIVDANQANVAGDQLVDHKGTVRYAYIDDVEHMPDRWFGYETADVVVLATGSQTFIKSLLDDESAPERRKALAEWVRHGGRLIVSVGAQRQMAAQVLDRMPQPDVDRMPLLNCRIEATSVHADAANLARWLSGQELPVAPLQNMEFTKLVPGEGVRVLVSESAVEGGKTTEIPVVVESACGLGRVWLTAFDLEDSPFKDWTSGQKAFWNRVQSEFTPLPVALKNAQGQPVQALQNAFDATGQNHALLAELQRSLENFESVPVVNFGWVALFILIYIIIVGPLDYILLTRVFKRPELTWVTFPVIVVGLSVVVYLSAYALKGEDLRINKIDLVEYDLNSPQQAYGTTWMTLFSPRIENYTFTLAPSAPGWAVAPAEDAASHAVVVSGLSNPDLSERAGSTTLFRKPYAYAEDASGMEHVPIPVWSTRTFQASWRAGLDPAKPRIAAHVSASRDEKTKLAGEIVNNLPVELQSVSIFYQGFYAPVDNVAPGQKIDMKTLFPKGSPGLPAAHWVGDARTLAPPPDPNQGQYPGPQTYQLMKEIMFASPAEAGRMSNSGVRTLDQSWRLNDMRVETGRGKAAAYRDEIVLVARAANLADRAEAVMQDPGSATRIWLDKLPGGKAQRPALTGYLAQQTYIRAYIPLTPDDKADAK